MDDTHLKALTDAAGIEDGYFDIEGRFHQTTPEIARLLLGALDLEAGTDSEIAASLDRLANESWAEILPPVTVGTDKSGLEVAVRLPAKDASRALRWFVDLEGGGSLEGEFRPDSLPLDATRNEGSNSLELRHLPLPVLPTGYHRLGLPGTTDATTGLIVAPRQCYLPPDFWTGRYWGVSAQLYALRSATSWGIGDFRDLDAMTDWLAACGADAIGLDPLHTPFLDTPQYASPYAPNTRLHLNPLHLDVTAIPDFAECAEARNFVAASAVGGAIAGARGAELVDYPLVASAKLTALEILHRHFLTAHVAAGTERGVAFAAFLANAGSELDDIVLFQALSEHLGTHKWKQWPAGYRDAHSRESKGFAGDRADRLSFFQYLQWNCNLQLSKTANHMAAKGMRIGLYRDLAVGVGAESADHWANQSLFAGTARIGAPPDPFNEAGQEWGVVPFKPRQLRASGYAHFIAMLRANMRHAGALRIDHIMGWQRLFVIPEGSLPTEGAYLRYPIDDLLAIAALESQRQRCMLVGEDLGTVPPGFRERLAAANALSCRVLYFERDGDCFRRPGDLPELSTIAATTHDLATLRGYWSGDDIAAKARLGIYRSAEEEQAAWRERRDDIEALLRSLKAEGLIPDPGPPLPSQQVWTPDLTSAVHLYLARSPARLLMLQLCDLDHELAQTNLPGTTTEYPNWRRRLERSLEDIAGDAALAEALARIARARGE